MKRFLPTVILGVFVSAKRFTETCEDIKIVDSVNLTANCQRSQDTLPNEFDYLDIRHYAGVRITAWNDSMIIPDTNPWPLSHQGDNTTIYPCQNMSLIESCGSIPPANPFSGYCSSTCTRFNNTDYPEYYYYINLGSSTLCNI
jgi:hypothetical protein